MTDPVKFGWFERILFGVILMVLIPLTMTTVTAVVVAHGEPAPSFSRATELGTTALLLGVAMACFGRPLSYGIVYTTKNAYRRLTA